MRRGITPPPSVKLTGLLIPEIGTLLFGACEEAVDAADGKAMVIDGVGVGIQFLIGMLSEGLRTAKAGVYRSAAQGRKARGQDWL
jgi:hypothetical protein